MSWLAKTVLFAQTATAEVATEESTPAEAGFALADAVEMATSVNGRLVLAVILGSIGLWLLLPGPQQLSRVFGAILAAVAAICFLSLAPLLDTFTQVPFSLMSGLTLVAAVSAVTARNPVYAAIWFALVLLGVGGLFLMNGAQFLGIATVAVYAGAIVVTFLFVLMLAQPDGHAFYDRVGWGKVSQFVGCFTGMVVAAAIVWAVMEPGAIAETSGSAERVVDNPQHVAALGGQLFTRHLAAVQAAGALLLAALVGAVAMASHGTGARGLDERMANSVPAATSGGADV